MEHSHRDTSFHYEQIRKYLGHICCGSGEREGRDGKAMEGGGKREVNVEKGERPGEVEREAAKMQGFRGATTKL